MTIERDLADVALLMASSGTNVAFDDKIGIGSVNWTSWTVHVTSTMIHGPTSISIT